MKRKIIALFAAMTLMLACMPVQAEENIYAYFIKSVDYRDEVTYVIGHRTPDSDSVASAIAYAGMLEELGINAKPAAAGELNAETKFALDYLGIEAPEILSDAAEKQFVLVDHSEYSQALSGMRQARIVGIVDHHGIGDVRNTELIPVRSMPAGASASVVYMTCVECNVKITREMARAMIMGILSDTQNFKFQEIPADKAAYEALLPIAEIEDVDALYTGMENARFSYEGMTVKEIFYSDYKEYAAGEYTFGIGLVETNTKENIIMLTEKVEAEMQKIYESDKMDMMFCMLAIPGTITCIIWAGSDAEAAVRESFPDYEGSGYLVFVPGVGRKKMVVPALTKTLEKWTETGNPNASDTYE